MKQVAEEAAREAIHKHFNCNGAYPCPEREYCEHCNGYNTAFDCNECGADEFKEGFMAGAEWRSKQSPWHLINEVLPECGRHVVNEDWFDFIAKDKKDLRLILKKYPFKIWAYVDDLIPQDFGLILKANKDVLKRMKEKGD